MGILHDWFCSGLVEFPIHGHSIIRRICALVYYVYFVSSHLYRLCDDSNFYS